MNQPLKGKRALVTGGSRGIGLACAVSLAQMGASVCLAARNNNDLLAAQKLLPGDQHSIVPADLSTREGCDHLLAFIKQNGLPHIVIGNFHSYRPNQRLASVGQGDISENINKNIIVYETLLPDILAFQRKEKFGRWIVILSTIVFTGGPGQGAYSAVKNALTGLVKTLAVEESHLGITANGIAAGLVDTQGVRERYDTATIEQLSRMNLIGRAAEVREIAHAAVMLAHPDASYITGVVLPVCGGYDLAWPLKDMVKNHV